MAGLTVDETIGIIKNSFGTYKKALAGIKSALYLIFLLSFISIVLHIWVFKTSDSIFMLFQPETILTAIIISIISGIVQLATFFPIHATITGAGREPWEKHATSQLLSLIRLYMVTLLFFSPSLVIGIITFAQFQTGLFHTFVPLLLIFFLVFMASFVVWTFLSPFLDPVVVLERRGPVDALKRIFNLAINNIVPLIIYYILLIIVGIALIVFYIALAIINDVIAAALGAPAAAFLTGLMASATITFFYMPWRNILHITLWHSAVKAAEKK